VFELCDCRLEADDSDRLIRALRAEGSAPSLEAAAAIRWGIAGNVQSAGLEPDLQATILASFPSGSSPGLR
jgi:hypothetical protein